MREILSDEAWELRSQMVMSQQFLGVQQTQMHDFAQKVAVASVVPVLSASTERESRVSDFLGQPLMHHRKDR